MKYRSRIYYTESDKALMWNRWQKGDSLHSIAGLFDCSHGSDCKDLGTNGPGEAAEEYGEYVTTWKKTDGQWRVMVDAGTTLKAEEE